MKDKKNLIIMLLCLIIVGMGVYLFNNSKTNNKCEEIKDKVEEVPSILKDNDIHFSMTVRLNNKDVTILYEDIINARKSIKNNFNDNYDEPFIINSTCQGESTYNYLKYIDIDKDFSRVIKGEDNKEYYVLITNFRGKELFLIGDNGKVIYANHIMDHRMDILVEDEYKTIYGGDDFNKEGNGEDSSKWFTFTDNGFRFIINDKCVFTDNYLHIKDNKVNVDSKTINVKTVGGDRANFCE